MKIAVVSGGFDPIHIGHLDYIKEASKLGDKLVVCLNSDAWLIKKKGKNFHSFEERKAILLAIKWIDDVIHFEDDECGSAKNGILKVQKLYPNSHIIFCNGGDRDNDNIPELSLSNIEFKFSVGGNIKKNSSSNLLKDWTYPREKRVWGSFYNLFVSNEIKLKELIVNPDQGMSFQRHRERNEIWVISEGKCIVNFSRVDEESSQSISLTKFDHFVVKSGEWHQITNPFNKICKLIEIQFGSAVVESDIERKFLYKE